MKENNDPLDKMLGIDYLKKKYNIKTSGCLVLIFVVTVIWIIILMNL